MENNRFRVLIIDDNPKIHLDFVKILAINEFETKINDLKRQLFVSDNIVQSKPSDDEFTIKMPVFEVVTASQGMEGLEKVSQALEDGKPFALAFIDVRMPPGLDGIQTIKKIWMVDKDIQIVICTAFSDYSWEQTVQELGLGDNLLILKKPFDNNVVRQMACALTKKWELARRDREYIKLLEDKSEGSTLEIAQHNSVGIDAVIVVSNNGIVEDVNLEFSTLWGLQFASLESARFEDVIEQMSKQLSATNKLKTELKRITLAPNKVITGTITLIDNRELEYYTQPHNVDNKQVGRLWCFRDVTHYNMHQLQLEHQATHDSLTNLPNRILLTDFVRYVLAAAERNKTMFAVVFIDLDEFKQINDNFSHEVGDEVLCQFSERIASQTRASDMFARYGGDEFILIAQAVTDEKYISEIIERLQKLIAIPLKIGDHVFNLRASIGVSVYPKDGKTLDELVHIADLAMYEHKLNGRR
jgi:diguanylate cyclase (GGDEF)-like protein